MGRAVPKTNCTSSSWLGACPCVVAQACPSAAHDAGWAGSNVSRSNMSSPPPPPPSPPESPSPSTAAAEVELEVVVEVKDDAGGSVAEDAGGAGESDAIVDVDGSDGSAAYDGWAIAGWLLRFGNPWLGTSSGAADPPSDAVMDRDAEPSGKGDSFLSWLGFGFGFGFVPRSEPESERGRSGSRSRSGELGRTSRPNSSKPGSAPSRPGT